MESQAAGPVLIEGVNLDGQGAASSNWAGKSSILEALSWCLKDKLVRYGDRRLGTEVCNQATGTADVTVTFQTPAGTAYITPTGRLQTIGTSPQRFFFMKCMAAEGVNVDINR